MSYKKKKPTGFFTKDNQVRPMFDSSGKFISSNTVTIKGKDYPIEAVRARAAVQHRHEQRLADRIAREQEQRLPLINHYIYFAGGDEHDAVELGVVRARTEKRATELWFKNANADERFAIGGRIQGIAAIPVDKARIKRSGVNNVVVELTPAEIKKREERVKQQEKEFELQKERERVAKLRREQEYKKKLKEVNPREFKKYDRKKLAVALAISNMGGEHVLDDAVNEKRSVDYAEQRWFESLAEGTRTQSYDGEHSIADDAKAERRADKMFNSEIASWRKQLRVMTDADVDKHLSDRQHWKTLVEK